MLQVDLIAPRPERIASVWRYMHVEAMVFLIIPILAAPMARASG
jgi:uncharacterized membrane protein